MWQRFRSSPSMVVAVVSLVVALLCVLYVMERPGTIAFGSPSSGGVRVIDAAVFARLNWDLYDSNRFQGDTCRALKVWDDIEVTVPEGKIWMVIVGAVPWNPSWGSAPNFDTRYGYYFEYTHTDGYGTRHTGVRWDCLRSGTYEDVNLYIYGSRLYGHQWYSAGAAYLVVEVDEYYEVGQ